MRCDVASNGPHEVKVQSGSILIPNADFVRCDMAPDGSWVATWDWHGDVWALSSWNAGPVWIARRYPNNGHYVRFQDDLLFHIYVVEELTSTGKHWAWDDEPQPVAQADFDASRSGSQGILDVGINGTILWWVDHNVATIDGIVVRNPITRNGRTACVLQEGFLGVSVFDYQSLTWYRVYTDDVQLNPRIADDGTVAVSAEPGGFFPPHTWTAFDPHSGTEPPPPHEDNMIAYGPLMTDWLLGETSPHADGGVYLKITKPNGKVVCVTPEGHVEEREVAAAWERFEKRGNALVAQRDLNGKPVVYVFPLA